MKNKQCEVLWECTWSEEYDFGGDLPHKWTRTFRIVSWSWEHDDGVRRIGGLHYEELTEDCMGAPIWRCTDEEHVPAGAMARLLQLAGILAPDADLSDITA